MAPPCTGQAGWARLNKVTAPLATQQSRRISNKLGDLCGELALHQARQGLHYIIEQPAGSMLYQRKPWQQLLEDGAMVLFDQCATGLTNSRGEPVQKRTDIRASSETLVNRLRSRQCRCTVPHATLEGKETKLAQIWTWQLAQVMALSIMDTLHAHLDKVPMVHPAFLFHDYDHRELMYNGNKVDFEEQYQVYGTMDGFGCPACKGHIARHDNRHTRDLEGEFNCKYSGEEPVEWACEGCRAHKPYLHDAHTWLPGECALAST
eukprot:2334769-Amphidinium_carterae.1